MNIMIQESTTQSQKTIAQTLEVPKAQTVPSLRNEATDDPHLFRVVDRENSWTHYYHDQLDKYLPSVNHILGIGFPKGAGLIQWLKNKTAEEADKILETAGERGSRVHDAIRELIKGQTMSIAAYLQNEDGSSTQLTIPEWDFLLSWQAWVESFKPQLLKHETAVFNKKYGYAGTVDFIGSIEILVGKKIYIDGKLQEISTPKRISCLLDWKTSGAVYNEYKLQVAAYAACMKLKPKQEFYTGIVRLGTKHKNGGFEMHLYSRNKTIENFKQFLRTKDTYHFINGTGWTPDIEQVPLVIKVDVPQITTTNGKPKRDNPRRPNVPGGKGSDEPGPSRVRGNRVKNPNNRYNKSTN